MPVVNELITEFGFEGNLNPLDDYNAALDSSIGLLVGFTTAVFASAAAIGVWVSSVTAGISPILQLSNNTEIAIESIQELGFAAAVSGSSIDAINSSLTGLSQKLGDAAQFGSEDFARLGISIRDANGEVKKADRVLLEVGRRFRELNFGITERISFAQRLGIDPSTVQLITKTGAEISKLRKRAQALGVVTREEAEAAERLNDINFELRFGFESLSRSIAVGIAPQMEELTKGFTELLIENKELISEGLKVTFSVIAQLAESLTRLLPVLGIIAGGFLVAKIAALGFAGVMAIIAAPIVLWTAGIVIALAVIEDLIVAFQGGESVIANFFKNFFDVDFVAPIKVGFEKFTAFIASIPESIKIVLRRITDVIQQITGGIFDDLLGGVPDWLVSLLEGNVNQAVVEMANQDVPAEVISTQTPTTSVAANSSSQDNSVNSLEQNNTFNITSDNPNLVANEITDTLQRQIEDAQNQFNTGGR